MFSCEFCKISKNTFFKEHLWTTASAFRLIKNQAGIGKASHFIAVSIFQVSKQRRSLPFDLCIAPIFDSWF